MSQVILIRPEVLHSALQRGNMQFRWPGGEPRAVFRARVQEAFVEIVAAHQGETIAIVSQGPVISPSCNRSPATMAGAY